MSRGCAVSAIVLSCIEKFTQRRGLYVPSGCLEFATTSQLSGDGQLPPAAGNLLLEVFFLFTVRLATGPQARAGPLTADALAARLQLPRVSIRPSALDLTSLLRTGGFLDLAEALLRL